MRCFLYDSFLHWGREQVLKKYREEIFKLNPQVLCVWNLKVLCLHSSSINVDYALSGFWVFFFHTLERCKNSLQTLKGTFFFSVYAFVFFGTTSPTSNMQVGEGKVWGRQSSCKKLARFVLDKWLRAAIKFLCCWSLDLFKGFYKKNDLSLSYVHGSVISLNIFAKLWKIPFVCN